MNVEDGKNKISDWSYEPQEIQDFMFDMEDLLERVQQFHEYILESETYPTCFDEEPLPPQPIHSWEDCIKKMKELEL